MGNSAGVWMRMFVSSVAYALAVVVVAGRAVGDTADLGRAFEDAYVSEVDGSRQGFGVFLPAVPPPRPEGYPVALHYHGYGWVVDRGFSDFQRRWAYEHGWVLANVNGRGPTFYDGIGENDVFRVLQRLDGCFGIDERRVYVTGASMGGTGAFRQGVRWGNWFAGVWGVDGWSHYQEWHTHWYARSDAPTAIEEFRRPLLQAAAASYSAPSAMTGNIGIVTDLSDNIVYPGNGQVLTEALDGLRAEEPSEFSHESIEHEGYGHGQGFSIEEAYRYFEDKQALVRPGAVRVATTQLKYGGLHWVQIERFVRHGVRADIEAVAADGEVTVRTDNVARFTLNLPDSPLAQAGSVRIVVDSESSLDLPPNAVTLSLAADATPSAPRWEVCTSRPELEKTSAIEGPIGHAFTKPFVLVSGELGDAATTDLNRAEAQRFADDWNGAFVHYPCVRPIGDLDVTPEQTASRSLILFGTEDDNRLLRDAAERYDLPIRVFGDRIVVRDPVNGDRAYPTDSFGVFAVYPNPLSGFRTYMVISHGQFPIRPDGTEPHGLGYDIEKLPWAWPDYVVFCKDPAKLPYVGNVNNKDSVLCYEAGYFVEAGYFDQDWQPAPGTELGWRDTVVDMTPAAIHLRHIILTLGRDQGRTYAEATLKVVDQDDRPVDQARVTVRWSGTHEGVDGGVTDKDGVLAFRTPSTDLAAGRFCCEVQTIMATGATHAPGADARRWDATSFGQRSDVVVGIRPLPDGLAAGDVVRVEVAVRNDGTEEAECSVSLGGAEGRVTPLAQRAIVPAEGTSVVTFWWDTAGVPAGRAVLRAAAQIRNGTDATPGNNEDLRVAELGRPVGQGG